MSVAFSLDAFTRDDRLRLFSFATAEHRVDYLWVLRAIERSRANYIPLLHAADVAGMLAEIAAEQWGQTGAPAEHAHTPRTGAADVPTRTADELTPLLDQLFDWQVLDRTYDGSRAASLSEYRNRHYVYQFTQAGYRAYRAVEEVLGAAAGDAALSRLVLPELLADLQALADANRAGDKAKVYRTLRRLDTTLGDMRERAARFYLMLSELGRGNEASADAFLAHKDALLVHMREFAGELARFAPKLAAAVNGVRATGVDRLVENAADADERPFTARAERLADWRQRWGGLAGWFTAPRGATSETTRLQDGTISAISALLALLRRITEGRRGGVSQQSQLRHLAAWFTAAPTANAAHALFDATFGLGSPRHVGVAHADPELIPARRSWWEAPPVELSRTLVETGKSATPGAPGRIERNAAGARRLRSAQIARQRARTEAAAALAGPGLAGRVLSEPETRLFLDLLDVALAARVPVTGSAPATAASDGVRLTLRPADESCTVLTVRGALSIDRMSVTVG